MKKIKKLYRNNDKRIIFGVCSGLGDYFNIDANLFRLLFIFLLIVGGSGLLLYIICAIVIPPMESKGVKGKNIK